MVDLVKIAPASEANWGRLVKTWATGVSHLQGVTIDKLPVPRTIQDIKDQCALPGVQVSITIPASLTGLAVLQHGPETLALRLPAKKMVEAAEAELSAQGATYPLPAFYSTFCGPLHGVDSPDKKKLLQALRIGDYSIGTCN
jgi:hypothetical protein